MIYYYLPEQAQMAILLLRIRITLFNRIREANIGVLFRPSWKTTITLTITCYTGYTYLFTDILDKYIDKKYNLSYTTGQREGIGCTDIYVVYEAYGRDT